MVKFLHALYFYSFYIVSSIFASLILLYMAPLPQKVHKMSFDDGDIHQFSEEKTQNDIKIGKTIYNNETILQQKVKLQIKNSFNSFWNFCKDSDYLQPMSNECINSSGLSITAVESLESLFISGLNDEYHDLSMFIMKDFTCKANKLQNFYEMGTKIIGGLIGIYSLTKQQEFLAKAIECADVASSSFRGPIPYPLINGELNTVKSYDFFNGNFLSESSGFILEFKALSKITENEKYANLVENYLNCIYSIMKRHNKIPLFLSLDECSIIDDQSDFQLNEYSISFLENLIRLHLYSPSQVTTDIINFISDIIEKSPLETLIDPDSIDSSFCQLGYLSKYIQSFNHLHDYLSSFCQSTPLLRNNSNFIIHEKYNGNEIDEDSYLDMMNQMTCGSALCSLISQNPIIQDDIMPSEYISKWLKFLYIGNMSTIHSYIINEAGHFIPS